MDQNPENYADLTQSGLNLIQQALTIYDKNLKLAICNSRFAEMFDMPKHLTTRGADFGETIRYWAEIGVYGDVGDVGKYVQERVEQAQAFEPHYVERRLASGMMISVEGSPLRAGGWVTVYTDITALKRHEELLRGRSEHLSEQLLGHTEELAQTNRNLAATVAMLEETKRQLIKSEALSRTTASMMPAHIAHIDLNEQYTYSNGKLGLIIDNGLADIEGRNASDVLGGEVYDKIKPYIDQAFDGHPSVFEFSHSNESRRVRAAFTPGRDGGGTINGIYFLTMDITEEAQSRAALMQTHKRELAAQLTSGLAHDFSNLLTIILGLQGRLEKLDGLPAVAGDMIATTRAAALRGGALLDRLSNVSGLRDVNLKATDLTSLFADIRALATPSLPDTTKLTLDCHGLHQPVLLDAGFLQDALLNLILNARDAIGDSTGAIAIVADARDERWLSLSVSDTGPGFSKPALKHALDPFFTTKRNDEGSGLGLTMVYDFAQMSGGMAKIGNTGKGAAVTLRLPLKIATAQAEPTLVLLVEDTPEIRETVREMLRDMGHSVLEASSAEEAEMLAHIPGVETILTDIVLGPEKSGLDLARQLAENGGSGRIFLMTSLPPKDKTRRSAAAEFPVIGKPFVAAELAQFLTADNTS